MTNKIYTKKGGVTYNKKICSFCDENIKPMKPIYMSKNQSYCSELCKFIKEKKYDELVIFIKKLDPDHQTYLLKKIPDEIFKEIDEAETKMVENTLKHIQGIDLPIDREEIIKEYQKIINNSNTCNSNTCNSNNCIDEKKNLRENESSNNEKNLETPIFSLTPNQLEPNVNFFGRLL